MPPIKFLSRSGVFAALLAIFVTGAKADTPRPGWFPFVIPGDDTASGTATDQRRLSPKPAGEDGFVRVENGQFVTDAGRFRIWGMNVCFGANFPSKEDAPTIAAHLAKIGVNGIRFHHADSQNAPTGLWSKNVVNGKRTFDPEMIDRLDFFLAELHKNGIYANLNLHCSRKLLEAEGFIDHQVSWRTSYNKYTLYFEPRMQTALKEFCRAFLLHKNPYRGNLRRIDDPAIAMMEITNENAFSTQGTAIAHNLPEPYRGQFALRWNEWLWERYRTDEKLRSAWGQNDTTPAPPFLTSAAWKTEHGDWSHIAHEGHKITSEFGQEGPDGEQDALRLRLSGPNNETWKRQYLASGFTLEKDQLYTLNFDYRASVPCEIDFELALGWPDPFSDLGASGPIEAGTGWKTFSKTFYAKSDAIEKGRACFNLGKISGDVWLANFTLRKGGKFTAFPEGQSLLQNTIGIPLEEVSSPQALTDARLFMEETEIAFSKEMIRFLQKDLRVKVPLTMSQINYHGWSVAHRIGADFADMHAYWLHPQFPNRPWDPKDWHFANRPLATGPLENKWPYNSILARGTWRFLDRPFSFSEWNSGEPMIYGASLVSTAAAVAAVQDWDAIFFFQYDQDNTDWFRQRIEGFFSMNAQPAKLAVFTACANIFRRGDLAPLTAEAPGTLTQPPSASFALSHRVGIRPENDTPTINSEEVPNPLLSTPDGSMIWDARDPEKATVKVDTQATKAVWGLVAEQEFTFGENIHIKIGTPENRYAVIVLTSTDGKPLTESDQLLLTAVGSAENLGMIWNEDKTSVGDNWGTGPTVVNGIPFTLTFPGSDHYQIHALDGTGKRKSEVSGWSFDASSETIWYEIVKKK